MRFTHSKHCSLFYLQLATGERQCNQNSSTSCENVVSWLQHSLDSSWRLHCKMTMHKKTEITISQYLVWHTQPFSVWGQMTTLMGDDGVFPFLQPWVPRTHQPVWWGCKPRLWWLKYRSPSPLRRFLGQPAAQWTSFILLGIERKHPQSLEQCIITDRCAWQKLKLRSLMVSQEG